MTAFFPPRFFGKTGLMVGRLGLGSSYGLPGREVERAFDHGVNFFLWGSRRRRDFGLGVRNLARTNRADIVVAVQTYTRMASLMEWSVDRALRSLRTDYVDVLCLAWWNGPTPRRIVDAALELRAKGKVRSLMVSCHHRPTFETFIADPSFDALMLRYNAAHPGADREVFPLLRGPSRPGVVGFTATRWGTLLNPRLVPPNEPAPRASDCYRFAMTNPHVDVTLTGPQERRRARRGALCPRAWPDGRERARLDAPRRRARPRRYREAEAGRPAGFSSTGWPRRRSARRRSSPAAEAAAHFPVALEPCA